MPFLSIDITSGFEETKVTSFKVVLLGEIVWLKVKESPIFNVDIAESILIDVANTFCTLKEKDLVNSLFLSLLKTIFGLPSFKNEESLISYFIFLYEVSIGVYETLYFMVSPT